MPRFPRMSPFHPLTTTPSEEVKTEALGNTREVLVALRDMLRQNELPATSLELAFDIFSDQLGMLVERDLVAKDVRKQKAIVALHKHKVTAPAEMLAARGVEIVDDGVGQYGNGEFIPMVRQMAQRNGIPQVSPDLLQCLTHEQVDDLAKANGIKID